MDTTASVVGPDDGLHAKLRQRRVLYTATTVALSALMALSVLDGVDVFDAWGVDDGHARATGGGYELDVRYPTVSRPALASPLEIVVRRPGGFTGPISIGVDALYMTLWDENGFYPSPSAERSSGELVVWEFDPPPGDTLDVKYDGRIEPAAQSGRAGRVAVLEADAPVVEVTFRTRVMP